MTLFPLTKNRTQCSPALFKGSVLQIINSGSLTKAKVSKENIPSKLKIVYGIIS